MNQYLQNISNTIDTNRIIKENFGMGFKHILVVLQDMLYNKFKKLYPQEFDKMDFDELWLEIGLAVDLMFQEWLNDNFSL